MKNPTFSKIRWSNSHGCHFANEYDFIPYNAPAVIKLKDGSLVSGSFEVGGFRVRISSETSAHIPWLELDDASVAIDRTEYFEEKAKRIEEKAQKLLDDARTMRNGAKESRANYRLALKLRGQK